MATSHSATDPIYIPKITTRYIPTSSYYEGVSNKELNTPTKCCNTVFFCYLTLLEHYDIIHAAQGHFFPSTFPIDLKARQELDQKRMQEAIAISPETNDRIQAVTDMEPMPVGNVDDTPLQYPLQQGNVDDDSASRSLISISHLIDAHRSRMPKATDFSVSEHDATREHEMSEYHEEEFTYHPSARVMLDAAQTIARFGDAEPDQDNGNDCGIRPSVGGTPEEVRTPEFQSNLSPGRVVESYDFPFPRQQGDGSYTPPDLSYAPQSNNSNQPVYQQLHAVEMAQQRGSTSNLPQKRSYAMIAPAFQQGGQPLRPGEKRRQSISYYTRAPQPNPQQQEQNRVQQQNLVNQQQYAHQQYLRQQQHQAQQQQQRESHLLQQRELERDAAQALQQQQLRVQHQQLAQQLSQQFKDIPARAVVPKKAFDPPPAAPAAEADPGASTPMDNASDCSYEDVQDKLTEKFTPAMNYAERDITKKKYPCKVVGCEKSFKGRNGLKYHMESAHGPGVVQRFACEGGGCGKRYKNLGGLRYHLMHCHPERNIEEDLNTAREFK